MANDKGARAATAGITLGAIAVAVLALTQKARAAEPGTEVILPKEFVDLIATIATTTGTIESDVVELINKLSTLGVNVGWPANADSITSLRVAVAVAGTQMPSIIIPSGMTLAIKAWTLNPGWLQVGASIAECTNVNQSFPLLPNEVVTYQVQNANQIYIAANAVGCFACLTVEQRRAGGG